MSAHPARVVASSRDSVGPRHRQWIRTAAGLLFLGVALVALINIWIVLSSRRFVFEDAALLPPTGVGLVLGTSPASADHRPNPHFVHRMEAATRLFRAGKVQSLLLSGAVREPGYDEPEAMWRFLRQEGVPTNAMILDPCGFRTLDSVYRAQDVFGLRRCILITDRFHAFRSVFLARHHGVDAVAFCSEPVPLLRSLGSRLREYAARVRAWLDVFAFRTAPRVTGEPMRKPLLPPSPIEDSARQASVPRHVRTLRSAISVATSRGNTRLRRPGSGRCFRWPRDPEFPQSAPTG